MREKSSHKGSSSEATDKNWRTWNSRWATEEWQSKKEGGGGKTAKKNKELGGYGLWNRDMSRENRKGRERSPELDH